MRQLILAVLLVLGLTIPAQAAYYVKVWGYEGVGNAPQDSHSFASFYSDDKLTGTISWLPATGPVRLLGVYTGHNFSLEQTLRIARENHRIVKSWGPYEITPETYKWAQNRIRLLESGKITYSAVVIHSNSMNCVTALNNTPMSSWGFAASEQIAEQWRKK